MTPEPELTDQILDAIERHRRPMTVRRLQRAIGDRAFGSRSMLVLGSFASIHGLSKPFGDAIHSLVLVGVLAFVQGPRAPRLVRNSR